MAVTYTVVVTDHDYPNLAIEREVLTAVDARLRTADATTPVEVIEAANGADALLAQQAPVTRAVFEANPDLAVVSRYGIGVDNVDVDAATEHGVPVANVPSYCEDEVSTHALALLLSCVRATPRYDGHVRDGGWDWKVGKPIRRLQGATLGLVAFGKIARTFRETVRGFGFDVIAYDEYVSAAEMADHDVETVGFDELLDRADVISIHAPLTDETEGLFDADAFAAMNADAYLINTARGPIVDEEALSEALGDDQLAGAGLDVMATEPPEDSPLFERDDVVLTPHVAWYSEESLVELRRKAALNVVAALRGERPPGLVNDDVYG